MVNLIAKTVLFIIVMFLVAELVPYNSLVDIIIGLFNFQQADKLTHFILGEPDLEVWESLREYFNILINTLISIPLFSAIIIYYHAIAKDDQPINYTKTWITETSRRLLKFFWVVFLFWVAIRIIPYESISNDSRSTFSYVTIVIANMLITIGIYQLTMKLIKKTRS